MQTGILTKIIDESISNNVDAPRDYLGASEIGNPCLRYLWYSYNKYTEEPISAKQRRTFAIGKRLEGLVLDCLADAGLCLLRNDLGVQDKRLEQFKGHVDALWVSSFTSEDIKAVIEVKTARDSSFRVFVKKGLLKWHPAYYSQVQSYMGMLGVHEAYVIVLNKDTSELHDQLIEFDAAFYESLQAKASLVINSDIPLPRVNESPLYFQCRICKFRRICHEQPSSK